MLALACPFVANTLARCLSRCRPQLMLGGPSSSETLAGCDALETRARLCVEQAWRVVEQIEALGLAQVRIQILLSLCYPISVQQAGLIDSFGALDLVALESKHPYEAGDMEQGAWCSICQRAVLQQVVAYSVLSVPGAAMLELTLDPRSCSQHAQDTLEVCPAGFQQRI